MPAADLIAECTFHAVDQTGTAFDVRLALGRPYRMDNGDWACNARLDGLDLDADTRGVDSWQALHLAYQLIANLLTYFVAEGGKLYYERGSEEATLADFVIPFTPR